MQTAARGRVTLHHNPAEESVGGAFASASLPAEPRSAAGRRAISKHAEASDDAMVRRRFIVRAGRSFPHEAEGDKKQP